MIGNSILILQTKNCSAEFRTRKHESLICVVTNQAFFIKIPDPGLEPGRPRGQWILNPPCLPFHQSGMFTLSSSEQCVYHTPCPYNVKSWADKKTILHVNHFRFANSTNRPIPSNGRIWYICTRSYLYSFLRDDDYETNMCFVVFGVFSLFS